MDHILLKRELPQEGRETIFYQYVVIPGFHKKRKDFDHENQ
jgi:hypothetical protein